MAAIETQHRYVPSHDFKHLTAPKFWSALSKGVHIVNIQPFS